MSENDSVMISDVDPINPNRSLVIKDLAMALSKAQGEFTIAYKSSTNQFFKTKYEDMVDLVKASRPALSKYGLSVLQPDIPDAEGRKHLYTILMHSSGQWIQSKTAILPPKSDIQTYTSYIWALKRIEYASLVGVVTSDDDDGEIAMLHERELINKGPATGYNREKGDYMVITPEQRKEIEKELLDPIMTNYHDEILDYFRIKNLADIPLDKYDWTIDNIRRIRKARNGK